MHDTDRSTGFLTTCLFLGVLATGCVQLEQPPFEPDCEPPAGSNTRILGEGAILGPSIATPGENIRVIGSARHLNDLTIRQVWVAGIPAVQEPQAFNFSNWRAEIPFEVVAAGATEDDEVMLRVTAFDVCDTVVTLDELPLRLLQEAPPEVLSLDLAVELPPDRDFVPMTLAVPVRIAVQANEEAAGAVVTFGVSSGGFAGGETQVERTLTLDGDAAVAEATWFPGEPAGTALVTASSQGLIRTASVAVADAPVLAPSSGSLQPGQSIEIALLSLGDISACSHSPLSGVQVTSNGASLGSPGASIGDSLQIVVSDDVPQAGTVEVVCRDSYGQSGTATFDISATPQP